MIQEALEGGAAYKPEEKERVKEWLQAGGTWRNTPIPMGVRRLEDISAVALRQIIAELETEGFVTQLERGYWGLAPQGMEEMIRQITKEVLSEATPLGLTYADQAAAMGLGKVRRPPPPGNPADPADELLRRWAADIRDASYSPTLEPIVEFLMQYQAFEDSYDQELEDERDIEDRS